MTDLRAVPFHPIVFPEYTRLYQKIERLKDRGVWSPENIEGLSPAQTVGDILDIDLDAFGRLPNIGRLNVRELSSLQTEIVTNPELVLETFDRHRAFFDNLSPPQTIKDDQATLVDFSFNFQFLDEGERKLLRKFNRRYDNSANETLFNISPRELRTLGAFGKAAMVSLQSLKHKITNDLASMSDTDPSKRWNRVGLLRPSKYVEINLGLLDQELLDSVEQFLFSLNVDEQDIALSRWSFHQEQETLEQIGRRHGVTRERIRQIEKNINTTVPDHIFVDPKLLRENIRENLHVSLSEAFPLLAQCFDSEKLFYYFVEILCQVKKATFYKISHPAINKRMLDEFFCTHATPIPYEHIIAELTSNVGYGSALAHSVLRELQRADRIEFTGEYVRPKNLGKREAIAHVLAGHPTGLPWKDVARLINLSKCCATKVAESRLEQEFPNSNYVYLSGRGTYRNLMFLDLGSYDIQAVIKDALQFIHANDSNSVHLVDYHYQAVDEFKRIDYFDLRHIIRTYGEDAGLFFDGKSGVDSMGATPDFESISQAPLIVDIMNKSKGAVTVHEIAARIRSKSVKTARLYLDQLMSEGKVVRVDNQMYTTPEKAFSDIDTDSLLLAIDDILLESEKPVEADVFRREINRQMGLSFPKYFYASLASLNLDEFGWYRSGNLFSVDELDKLSLRAFVEEYCSGQDSNAENLNSLKKHINVTDQVGLIAINAWRSA